MTDWKSRLRDADPARTAVMPDTDVQRIRRVVLAAARAGSGAPATGWPRAFVVPAALLVFVCASALAALQGVTPRLDARHTATLDIPADEAVDRDSDRQQLQFRTPGGTRIIWVFDSQFEVRGTVP